jgi:hypothetical protein
MSDPILPHFNTSLHSIHVFHPTILESQHKKISRMADLLGGMTTDTKTAHEVKQNEIRISRSELLTTPYLATTKLFPLFLQNPPYQKSSSDPNSVSPQHPL